MPAPGSTSSLGAHVRQLEKSMGRPARHSKRWPEAPPELPQELRYVWDYYRDIERGGRTSSGSGVNRIQWSEIGWWEHHTGIRLHPWEVEVIKCLDEAFVAAFYESLKHGNKLGDGRPS